MMAGRYLQRRGWRKDLQHTEAGLRTAMFRRPDILAETVIDVGASDGCWSEAMMQHFPNANYLLVEAQEATHGAALKRFQATHSNVKFEFCAAGDHEGEIHFEASGPFGGVAAKTPFQKNDITVAMKTIDGLVRRNNLARALCPEVGYAWFRGADLGRCARSAGRSVDANHRGL